MDVRATVADLGHDFCSVGWSVQSRTRPRKSRETSCRVTRTTDSMINFHTQLFSLFFDPIDRQEDGLIGIFSEQQEEEIKVHRK